MYDDWRDRIVACVHEDSRDERKAQRYQAMIRDWVEELVRSARPRSLPARTYFKRELTNWTDEEIENHLKMKDLDGPGGVERRGAEGNVILYDPIEITTRPTTPLNKKYATLAAIHDASEHCDFPLNPWAEEQSPQFELELKYGALQARVGDLTDTDRSGVEHFVVDVSADLKRHLGSGEDGESAPPVAEEIVGWRRVWRSIWSTGLAVYRVTIEAGWSALLEKLSGR